MTIGVTYMVAPGSKTAPQSKSDRRILPPSVNIHCSCPHHVKKCRNMEDEKDEKDEEGDR